VNRRGFLASIAALSAAIIRPSGIFSLNNAGGYLKLFSGSQPFVGDTYTCILHPDFFANFVSVTARGRWIYAYRAARNSGDRRLSAQEILFKYGKTLSLPVTGEIGRMESVRFIVTKEISRGI
jgi:hypothetical protein